VFITESLSGARLKIFRVELRTGARALWKEIAALPGDQGVYNPRITPDGKSYAYTYFRNPGNLYLVDGLK